MPRADSIEGYLVELEGLLRLSPESRRRVIDEMRSHLEDAVVAERAGGADLDAAVAAVLARVGGPREVARRYPAEHPGLDLAVLLGALACLAVAGWLFVVTATVLQAQDPGHVTQWRLVAAGFVAYAAVTVAYLALRLRSRFARGAAAASSVVAITAGAWFAVPMILTTGDFEGYVVLIGAVLAGEGIVVLTSTVLHGPRTAADS